MAELVSAIMQPTYLPWLGYFDLIDQVDQFVYLDDVQLVRRSWGVRNRVRTANGPVFLSVSVSKDRDRRDSLYSNTSPAYQTDWNIKHLATLRHAYQKAPYYDEVYGPLELILTHQYDSMASLNTTIIEMLCTNLGITTKRIRSSTFQGITGVKDDRLLSIMNIIGGDSYLAVPGSASYLQSEHPGGAIQAAGIDVYFQVYDHPRYEQLHGGFDPYMSSLDLFFNHGWSTSLDVIRSGRREPVHCRVYSAEGDV